MPKDKQSTKKAGKTSVPAQPDTDGAAAHTHDGASPHTRGAAPPTHMLTINIPLDEAIDVAAAPVKMAGRVLSAKGGLPLYGALGVLAAAQVIEWPVAAATGVGYAVLRRWGPLRPTRGGAPGGADVRAAG